MQAIANLKDQIMPTGQKGGRKSRRHSRKSRHGETDRKRQHKGGKSRRTSRKSRHASRK